MGVGEQLVRARALGGRVRRRARAARAGFESRVVWIFGSPRSGSTWLLQLLGEHEAVVPINEPNIGTYLSPFLSDQPGFGAEGLDTQNFTLRRVQANKPEQFFATEFADVWRPSLARLMLDRFLAHAKRYPSSAPLQRTLVVVKEPNGSESADLIMGTLPRSRLIFLLRDGRDVVDSDLAARQRDAWAMREFPGLEGIAEEDRLPFVIQSAHKWLWRTEVVEQAYAAHPGPKLRLRYEDLREDPEKELRRLFAWLGLPIAEDQLVQLIGRHEFERLPKEARGPKEFFRAASPGLWRKNLTAEEQEAVMRVIGGKLDQLGYER
jgi:hypothetical protein